VVVEGKRSKWSVPFLQNKGRNSRPTSTGGAFAFERISRIQIASYPRDMFADIPVSAVDYNEFYQILNRPDGWRPAGTEGPSSLLSFHSPTNPLHLLDEFVKGFQVFDKEGRGKIGAGELRYVLTQLGEKMTDEEVDELLKGFPVV
jgi:Ca2+-binding EF-hand superfamily protein